jgi:hypothetical protein
VAILHQLWQLLATPQLIFWLLWAGLAALSLAMVVLLWTRWGQSQPLVKCLVLSLYAHFLMFIYSTTVELSLSLPGVEDPPMNVALLDQNEADDESSSAGERSDTPWEELLHDAVPQPVIDDAERAELDPLRELPRESLTRPDVLPDTPALEHMALSQVNQPDPQLQADAPRGTNAPRKEAEMVEVPAATRREAPLLPVPPLQALETRATPEELAAALERTASSGVPTALLERMTPLPRLRETPTAVDPGSALADRAYELAATGRGAPAAATGRDGLVAITGNQAQAMTAAGTTGIGRTQSPDLAGLMGRGAADALASAGAPPVDTHAGAAQMPAMRRGERGEMPDRYRLRVAPNRAQLAQQQGATAETEHAVHIALRWLADNQAANGRWDASDHGAGREDMVLGRSRQNAGIQADTGVTGLTLLAFLAAGHTHFEGEYRETVRRGLEFLLRSQARDGSLGADADSFARMYCHAMATLALSEALGMTNDERLRDPVRRALAYTVASQSNTTGGWRYVPADPGDTSQLGWQWMALKSGEAAGIPIPDRTREGVAKFLRSVSSGTAGGLAAYRPGEGPSRTMTAEALYCWILLGLPADHPAVAEASEALLGEMPGMAKHNCYYWYYATLALYQLQNDAWRRWNDSLTQTLVARQRKSGPQAGSWDTDTVWGGYGGRVYTTAISTLTLEVYYRYLPLYSRTSSEH